MGNGVGKPRLLYYDVDISALKSCERVQSEAEQQTYDPHFEVTRIFAGKRDFAEDVKEYRPDLVVFTGFVERPIDVAEISNTEAFPEIPRVGIHTTDIFCPLWWANYQRFLGLGAQAAFSNHFVPGLDWDREMKIPCYYLPRMIADAIFRDYGEEKLFHAGLFGYGFWQPAPLYPWRHAVARTLVEKMVIAATGRVDVLFGDDPLLPFGESYARLINRCVFGLACCSAIRRPVEKCLQIPGAMACLVTDDSTILRSYGFRDLENCVVVDETNALEKLRGLLRDRTELQGITERGHRLVHERYVGSQPKAFLEWLHAFRRLRPGERVVQTGVMDFDTAGPDRPDRVAFPADPNLSQVMLPLGFKALSENNLDEARDIFISAYQCYGNCNTPLNVGNTFVFLFERKLDDAFKQLRGNMLWLEAMSRGRMHHDPAVYAACIMTLLSGENLESLHTVMRWSEGAKHPLIEAARLMVRLRSGELSEPVTAEALNHLLFDDTNCQSECPIMFADGRGYVEFMRRILEVHERKGLLRRYDRVFGNL